MRRSLSPSGLPKLKPTPKLELKYLFKAVLVNGEVVRQTPKDRCPTNPSRTAYWDLLLKGPDGEPFEDPVDKWLIPRPDILTFELIGPAQRFLVDLRDGHFEIDGRRADSIDWKPLLKPLALPLSLIYFRRRRQHFNLSGGDAGQDCEYHFGWKDPKGASQTLILT